MIQLTPRGLQSAEAKAPGNDALPIFAPCWVKVQLQARQEGSFTMAEHRQLGSPAVQCTALTVIARIGFGARGVVYLLVAAFATAAALGFGQQPHGIMDAVQAIPDTQLQVLLAAVIGTGLASLEASFAIAGLWRCCRDSGARRWLFAAGMLGDALIYAAVM